VRAALLGRTLTQINDREGWWLPGFSALVQSVTITRLGFVDGLPPGFKHRIWLKPTRATDRPLPVPIADDEIGTDSDAFAGGAYASEYLNLYPTGTRSHCDPSRLPVDGIDAKD